MLSGLNQGGLVKSWALDGRTCYVCEACQPRPATTAAGDEAAAVSRAAIIPNSCLVACAPTPADSHELSGILQAKVPAAVFNSHCARESLAARLAQGPHKLTVPEIKAELTARGLSVATKPEPGAAGQLAGGQKLRPKAVLAARLELAMLPVEPAAAAREKVTAGEKRNVEHVADSLGPAKKRAPRAVKKKKKKEAAKVEVPAEVTAEVTAEVKAEVKAARKKSKAAKAAKRLATKGTVVEVKQEEGARPEPAGSRRKRRGAGAGADSEFEAALAEFEDAAAAAVAAVKTEKVAAVESTPKASLTGAAAPGRRSKRARPTSARRSSSTSSSSQRRPVARPAAVP